MDGWRAFVRELALVVMTLGVVIGATVALLRGLDSFPGSLLGESRGVKRYGSIEEVERKLKQRVLLPAYFPDTLQWPPSSVRLASRPPVSVLLAFTGREGGKEQLFLAQVVGEAGSIAPQLLPPGLVLHTAAVSLGGIPGALSRIKGEDGAIWHEIIWFRDGRQVSLRFDGPVEELLRIARSVRRE